MLTRRSLRRHALSSSLSPALWASSSLPILVISGGGHWLRGRRQQQHQSSSGSNQRRLSARSLSTFSVAHTPNRCWRCRAASKSSRGITTRDAVSRRGASAASMLLTASRFCFDCEPPVALRALPDIPIETTPLHARPQPAKSVSQTGRLARRLARMLRLKLVRQAAEVQAVDR